MTRVTLTVERLVLRGFPPGARDAIAASFRSELQTLLARATSVDGFGGSRSLASLPASWLRVPANGAAHEIGARAAAHIVRGIKGA